MAITKFTRDMDIIARLDDEPNDVSGLSAAELKAEFDKAGHYIQDYLNAVLLAELSGEPGAGAVGIARVEGLTGVRTVQEALEKIQKQMQEITQGTVADGSISEGKLADGAVTADKLRPGAVTPDKLAEAGIPGSKLEKGSVGGDRLTASSVPGDALAPGAVAEDRLADGAVTSRKLAGGAVGTDQLDALSVTGDKLMNGSVGILKLDRSTVTPEALGAATARAAEITLTPSGWNAETLRQSAAVSGLSAGDHVIAAPAEESREPWGDCGIRCSAQSAGTLSFGCESLPGENVRVNLLIVG